jgi:hypothetical protein
VTVAPMPAGRGVARSANVSDGHRRDGPPGRVVRRKHRLVAMPVLRQRWDKVSQTIEKRKWRELNIVIRAHPPQD